MDSGLTWLRLSVLLDTASLGYCLDGMTGYVNVDQGARLKCLSADWAISKEGTAGCPPSHTQDCGCGNTLVDRHETHVGVRTERIGRRNQK